MKCQKCGFAMLDNWVHYKGALECVLECESCEHTVPYTHPLVRDALAASRRALTMAEREMRLPSIFVGAMRGGSVDGAREAHQAALDRTVKAKAAITAARTAMDRAQGRSTR